MGWICGVVCWVWVAGATRKGVLRSAFCVLRSAFCVLRSAFCVSAFLDGWMDELHAKILDVRRWDFRAVGCDRRKGSWPRFVRFVDFRIGQDEKEIPVLFREYELHDFPTLFFWLFLCVVTAFH